MTFLIALPVVVSFVCPFERVLGEVFVVGGAAAKLGDGRQLEHGHGLLDDAHRLLVDLVLLGLGATPEAGHSGPAYRPGGEKIN